mmetsp:Transcript_18148/g.51811  ORF Transcript_18148/g.51811 Transcript_18148/m.51811 type:complete len:320 (-) Transcript_18148:28-987(-)
MVVLLLILAVYQRAHRHRFRLGRVVRLRDEHPRYRHRDHLRGRRHLDARPLRLLPGREGGPDRRCLHRQRHGQQLGERLLGPRCALERGRNLLAGRRADAGVGGEVPRHRERDHRRGLRRRVQEPGLQRAHVLRRVLRGPAAAPLAPEVARGRAGRPPMSEDQHLSVLPRLVARLGDLGELARAPLGQSRLGRRGARGAGWRHRPADHLHHRVRGAALHVQPGAPLGDGDHRPERPRSLAKGPQSALGEGLVVPSGLQGSLDRLERRRRVAQRRARGRPRVRFGRQPPRSPRQSAHAGGAVHAGQPRGALLPAERRVIL